MKHTKNVESLLKGETFLQWLFIMITPYTYTVHGIAVSPAVNCLNVDFSLMTSFNNHLSTSFYRRPQLIRNICGWKSYVSSYRKHTLTPQHYQISNPKIQPDSVGKCQLDRIQNKHWTLQYAAKVTLWSTNLWIYFRFRVCQHRKVNHFCPGCPMFTIISLISIHKM